LKKLSLTVCLLALGFGLADPVWSAPIRIKDLVEFDGVRSNDLVG
jgi:flagellar P-ring protein precursor FlgI